MVLHPWQNRSANLSLVSNTLLSSTSWITSYPDLEPLICKEANWFVCWHNAIKSEIAALNENGIFSLVPFDPTMNVVGFQWMYKIKR
jgi:hypothetical protein